jgi:hypothetical protein
VFRDLVHPLPAEAPQVVYDPLPVEAVEVVEADLHQEAVQVEVAVVQKEGSIFGRISLCEH